MKNLKLLSGAILLSSLFVMSSCKDEDSGPSCKQCSAEVKTYIDGTLFAEQTVSDQQICDEQLEAIEANPVVTVTQNVGGIQQEITSTYTCK